MKDKVVIITGGSSGIGRALAEEFGTRGSKVLITGRNQDQLEKTVSDLRNKGIIIESFVSDVSVEADNQQMAQEAIKMFGTIDVLINNAGISMRALFEDV
ncbi:MAG TPA: SDR family NAD(P)-dependent oxidoreductase, partial [Chryseolinea sp.]